MGKGKGYGLMMLAGIGIASSAFVVGLALAVSPAVPGSVTMTTSTPSTFELTSQKLVDARTVKLSVHQGGKSPVQVPRTGTVTALGCAPGSALSSWQSFIAVDGVNLLSVATTTPLYRDLHAGDSGDDVRALQEELRRLGKSVRADGVLGLTSIEMVNTRLRELGGHASSFGTIARDSIVWLPVPEGTAASCAVTLGGQVESGAAVAALDPQATGADVSNIPHDLVPGQRVVVVGELRLPVDESGAVTTAEDISALRRTTAFKQALQASDPSGAAGSGARTNADSGGSVTLDASLELASPLETWAVPPGAIFALKDNRGCTSSEGSKFAVEVVGSELGKSFVVFPDSEVPDSVDAVPDGSGAC